MLTQEQIKNLKHGDPLIIHGTYMRQYSNGDIVIRCNITRSGGELGIDEKYLHPSCVSLPSEHGTSVPTPKHDPCRLFKKGDIVEIDTHARDIAASMKKSGVELGKRYTVTEDENNTGYVSFIGEDGIERHSMFFWLKLVTPAEEIEPYELIDSPNTYNIVRDSAMVMTIHKKSHPNAKAAAEAERDRLNDEYRKEQNNG